MNNEAKNTTVDDLQCSNQMRAKFNTEYILDINRKSGFINR